jgi:hypothetical protein
MSDRKQTSSRNSRSELDKIEMRPDGWERFLHAVGWATKSGPKHRPMKKKRAKKR